MDFAYSEEQEAVRELAGRIFTERSTHERLKAVESAAGPDGPFDRELWTALAEAGLLGIGLPEDVGGADLDFVAVCLVVEAAGRTAAHVPLVETLVYGAAAIDRFGTDEQRRSWLPRVAAGEVVLTAGLAELVGDVVVPGGSAPSTTATRQAGGWRLEGTKACVPAGLLADLVLVPATLLGEGGQPDGLGVFLVATDAAGLRRTRQDGPALPEALLELSGVVVSDDALLGGAAADAVATVDLITQRATAALCVEEAGVAAAAVALIGEYTKTREQFEKPIATFQAVGQRAADAYVDAEAIRLTAWQATWRLSADLPATAEVATAKFWAADGGQRVVHAAVHLHGGVGVDRDYPLHRLFLITRQIELTLGGAHASLQRLGAVLAADPA
ncbi:MAG TPA: acyl-CoA dehydrogenase family protein [Acidimicrobiales bacterium]|jgi:alkylation response protein AidB-like acyl-CoA dehydrogenase|nr:acyl-CoA dehydrogenase family protein [Acidimicrobiales bacterium]